MRQAARGGAEEGGCGVGDGVCVRARVDGYRLRASVRQCVRALDRYALEGLRPMGRRGRSRAGRAARWKKVGSVIAETLSSFVAIPAPQVA